MAERNITICRDAAELHRKAAEKFIQHAQQAGSRAGRFSVALSGGSTPKGLYSLLGQPAYRERVPWAKVHLFWGDERCVPPDRSESNYRMAEETLLSKIGVPGNNVHRMAGEKEPNLAALEYAAQLEKFFQLRPGAWPRFDLILLGIGEDGHTASLFPASDAFKETQRLVIAPFVTKLGAHRLTLTLPVLNHAAEILFLVAGQGKAAIVKRILEAPDEAPVLPAARVRPEDGRLTWFLTQDAATELRDP